MSDERRTITPTAAQAQLAGATRLAPGLWRDRDGYMHVSVPELLVHFGWPDTAENRALLTRTVSAWLQGNFPESTVVEQDVES